MTIVSVLKRVVLAILLLIFPLGSYAAEPPSLFIDVPIAATAQARTPHDPTIVRQRKVGINLALLAKPDASLPIAGSLLSTGKVLRLNLFDDVDFNVVLSHWQPSSDTASYTWIGLIDGVPDGQVILVVRGQVVSGNITTPDGKVYQIRYDGSGLHVIREIDPSRFPAEDELPTIDGSPDPDALVANTSTDDGSTIDVMVVYTPAARIAVGGTTAMQALIDLAVAETNEGYANSGVIQRIRLVHTQEVAYVETVTDAHRNALIALQNPSDGLMDEVHPLRNTHAADMVSLFIESNEYCGRAYVMGTPSNSFESHAFSVVWHACAAGYYSFAHELAHNQGSQHDRANADSTRSYDYSYGYADPGEEFRTIMSYNCPGGCPRLNYWSNPDVFINNKPTGIVHTAPDAADNHLSLNNNRVIAANWRVAETAADLVIENLVTTPDSAAPESSMTVTFDVANRGTGSVTTSSTAGLYLSTDLTLDATDVDLGSCTLPATELLPDATHACSQTVAIPANTVAGSYVILVEADTENIVTESDELNNLATTPITVTTGTQSPTQKLPIALVTASSFQDPNVPSNTLDGSLATRWSAQGSGQWIQYDLGTSEVTLSTVYIAWYRGDERASQFDVEVSIDAVSWTLMLSGSSSGTSIDLEAYDIPEVTARYVRIVGYGNSANTWNSITEVELHGHDDSTGGTTSPDLVVENLTVSPGGVTSGGAVTVSHAVANRGTETVTANHTAAIYLSTNDTLEEGDPVLGNCDVDAVELAPGQTHNCDTTVIIPAGTGPGSYYILVQADAQNTVAESNETNNLSITSVTISTASGSVEVFYDSFEVATWNGLWTEDGQNDWFRSTQRSRHGSYAAEVDGGAKDAALMSIPIDLQGRSSVTVTFSWYIEASLDTGEYLAFDVSTDGGSSWTEYARLRGNVDTEGVWHDEQVMLTGISSLRLRFRGKMSKGKEDANVDLVKVLAE